MTAITLDRLGKDFGGSTALHEVSLEFPSGAFVVLLGPSGCGKTTTLRMLAGLEEPTRGRIRFGDRVVANGDTGESVPAEKRGLGMVFQSYALWPHMSVRTNIDWPLRVARWSAADRQARVTEVLAMLGITALADRYPAEISGGQQQRVAIARTIAARPQVLLFDEPLSNLDARLRVDTRAELAQVHRATGGTSVYVTHDQVEALALATHIAVMRDGRVEQFGPPAELLEHPATAFVASFLGTPPAVLLAGEASGGWLRRSGAELTVASGEGRPLKAMYRPQDVGLGPSGCLQFDVVECTPLAGRYVVSGLSDGDRVSIITETPVAAGTSSRLILPETPAALFGADDTRVTA
ncbi:carbohydrate ABC transporter ATP-binding protein (CUT1 family) [Glaciihabitans tibetensis]|uniref:Carbohydrate ABC transporter ATP-binding protein (CUT1 family) n=1 Tax=Glaciihabitans tibetensis TaxID=1266600 RepID=A0A2T0V5M1_9MICO|nr:ABC transporter ATP-binding protein [Glaciihabitans tibetensis]PRY65453.1 carbohydrate ABC transporter ATP-binding protein (CUT1 family) [Glaciihabitans tibetensis]